MANYLFKNGRIFDGSGTAPFEGDVLVTDGRFAAVGTVPPGLVPPGVEAIAADGLMLMPGLVEAHAHLSWPSSVGRIINSMTLPQEEHLLVTAHNAKVTLDSGFTSAYSAGSLGARFEIALRDEIDAGWLPGPRLRASTLERLPDGALGLRSDAATAHPRGPEAMRAYVDEMAKAGVDCIKFLLTSDDAFVPGGSLKLTYDEDEVAAIGEAARRHGLSLSCHVQAAAGIKSALRHGFRVLYHCSHADSEALDMLEAQRDRVFVAPAVGLLYSRVHEAREFGIDPASGTDMGAQAGLERMQALYPAMRKRGIRVLPGGDYGFPYNPIGRNARDLQLFVDLFGYSPTETLVAATRLGGELMAGPDPIGMIRPGYLADLLAIDGDPTGDVRILEDASRMKMIMKDGRFHRRAAASRPSGGTAGMI